MKKMVAALFLCLVVLPATASVFFFAIADFEDGSSLSATYSFDGDGRVCLASAPVAFCPTPGNPCLAENARREAFNRTPPCQRAAHLEFRAQRLLLDEYRAPMSQ